LLPRYRGSAPVRAAILSGDETTGVSIIKLIRRLDAGPLVRQRVVDILPGENAHELEMRLAGVAAEMLPETCLDWLAGAIEAREQDEEAATMTREWNRDDARVDWSRDAASIARLVRASQPWPVAWTTLAGEPFRIHAASIAPDAALPAATVQRTGGRILAGCGAGTLVLEQVQPAGKRPMQALNWWNGVQAAEVHFDSSAASPPS
jgi:methionyl-tRNA formyltransferase